MLNIITDITLKNVLVQLRGTYVWSMETHYKQFGRPVREEILLSSGEKPDLSAPEYLVKSASLSRVHPHWVSEQVLLTDLGEAFLESSPPTYGAGTPVSYRSPELTLERKASRASDIWALACTIFQSRSGFPLFESFVNSSTEVLGEMVRILGIPPEASHSFWKKDGSKISDRRDLNELTLIEKIKKIGVYDEESFIYDTDPASSTYYHLLEPRGRRMKKEEINALAGLLQRALDYTPENRLSAEKIANHRWFEWRN